MATVAIGNSKGLTASLRERYSVVRRRSVALCEPLTPEDMMVQSCPEASPAKWHLAHTAWFFESFVLKEYLAGYEVFNPEFTWLFNSYYQTFAEFPDKRLRASFSRPGLDEVFRFREHVDAEMDRLLEGDAPEEALRRIELGLHHEEQHQELLLTDVKHALFTNPLQPPYLAASENSLADKRVARPSASLPVMSLLSYEGGLVEIGQGPDEGFGFDNERPRHRVWLEPFQFASRLVTCGEYAEFIADRGYDRPELWLSAGWDAISALGWKCPLYWQLVHGVWNLGTLRGKWELPQVADTPVTHVSYFEADAYARWRGLRLPTEAEWETVAATVPIEGNLLESGELRPVALEAVHSDSITGSGSPAQLFGDCWEWTSSAYLGYPGFAPLEGSLGEYNGKFMSGQMILRGGSCVTPRNHIRASYRNFFPPETRWQFSGLRLASS